MKTTEADQLQQNVKAKSKPYTVQSRQVNVTDDNGTQPAKGKRAKRLPLDEFKDLCRAEAVKGLENIINVAPLSVNEAWKGKRYKTFKYKLFERHCMFVLEPIQLPEKPFKLSYVFGFSNVLSDIDNPVKPMTDILQKKYKFNDRDIFELHVKKVLTKKGQEFISFKIESL